MTGSLVAGLGAGAAGLGLVEVGLLAPACDGAAAFGGRDTVLWLAGFEDGDGAIGAFGGAVGVGRGGAAAGPAVDGAGLAAGEGLFKGPVCGCTVLLAGCARGGGAAGGVARAGPGTCC